MACKEGREEMSDVFSGAPENCDAAAEEDTKGSGGARAAVVGSRTMLSLSVGFFSPSDVGREEERLPAPHRNRILPVGGGGVGLTAPK